MYILSILTSDHACMYILSILASDHACMYILSVLTSDHVCVCLHMSCLQLGKTACHYAAQHGHLGVLTYLYDYVVTLVTPPVLTTDVSIYRGQNRKGWKERVGGRRLEGGVWEESVGGKGGRERMGEIVWEERLVGEGEMVGICL